MSVSKVIAIDGAASSGKTSVAKIVSEKLNWSCLSSGEIYRYFTYLLVTNIEKNGDVINDETILKSTPIIKNKNIFIDKNKLIFEEGDLDLYDKKIGTYISTVSELKKVRKIVNKTIKKISKKNSPIIVDGRDIGTVVFPKAFIKFYLTVDLEVSAKRRFNELQEKGLTIEYKQVKDLIKKRNINDETRKHGPLKKAIDAILIDTSKNSLESVVKKINTFIKNKIDNND